MPLLGNGEYREPFEDSKDRNAPSSVHRKQSQHSITARIAMNKGSIPSSNSGTVMEETYQVKGDKDQGRMTSEAGLNAPANGLKPSNTNGHALSDTPATTPATSAPSSPTM